MHHSKPLHGHLASWLLGIAFIAPALAMPGVPIQTPSPSRLALLKRQSSASSSQSVSMASDQCLTPYGGLPNLCTGVISLPAYTAAYSGGSSAASSSSSSSSSSAPANTAAPICENEADPDNDGPDMCYCSQGSLTTSVAAATGSNPCPWTALPITSGASAVPSFTPPSETNTNLYSVTQGFEIVGCVSSIVSRVNNVDVTSCAGSSYTVGMIPHATVQVGSSTQNVGTLSSAALFTAVSSALESACPPPASGTFGACTAAATIAGVSYTFNETIDVTKRDVDIGESAGAVARQAPDMEKRLDIPISTPEKVTVIKSDGDLKINVLTSNYTSTGIRDSMIILAASTFAGSASGNACASFENQQADGSAKRGLDVRQTAPSTVLCSSTTFAGVEYMNEAINPGDPAAFLGVELAFQNGMDEILDEVFECEELVNGILGIVAAIFPELAPLEVESEELISYGCEVAMTIGDLASS